MILQQIRDAHLAARKARDSVRLTTLTTLIGEITKREKDEARALTDAEVSKILSKFIASGQEMATAFGDRRDSENFEAASAEVELYKSFLPAAKPQLSAEALERTVRSIIAEKIAFDAQKPKMGDVLAGLKLTHEGEYDPKAAAALVKDQLAAIAL